MAGDGDLTLTLRAQNLSGPAFRQLKKDLDEYGAQITHVSQKTAQGSKEITSSFAGAGKAGQDFSQGIAQGLGVAVPLSIGAAATAVAAFGVDAVKHFAAFEKAMRGVNSLLGLSGAEAEQSFKSMSAGIREFAVRMGVDATDAAKGLYQVISAGIPAGAEAFRVLEVASKAAVGGMTETSVAVDGLSSILNAYHLSADDAGKISDQMFQVVNRGKVTFQQLSNEIGGVTPLAAQAGIGFGELGGAIATQTKQGLSAGQSITGLQQVIQQYLKPSSEAADISKALGLQFDAAALKSKGLRGALEEASAAAGGDQEILARLFGSVEALRTVLALTGQNAQGFTEDIRGVSESAGAADLAFEEMNKSGARKFEELGAKINDLKLRIGEMLTGPAIGLTNFIDGVGTSLGLWPKDVPPQEQVKRFDLLAMAAQGAALAIQNAVHWQQIQAGIALVGKLKEQAEHVWNSARATDAYADAESKLTANLVAGLITGEEYNAQLKAIRAARLAQTEAEAEAEAASRQAADATRDQAQADEEAASAAQDSAASEGLSAKEKIAAYNAAQKAAQAAADEAKRLAAQQASDAKRLAEQIARATESATRSWQALGQTVENIVADSGDKILDIQDRHDTDYNQAIIDATDAQIRIKDRATGELARIEQQSGENILRIRTQITAIEQGQDEANYARRKQLRRQAEDDEVAAAQRAEDRSLDAQRRDDDRAKARGQAAADRVALERRFAHGGTEETDAKKAQDRSIGDARKQYDRDIADETTRHERELRDETTRHERALRDAADDNARGKENERHSDALAKEQERHDDAVAKRDQRYSDDQERANQAHLNALERIKQQYDEQKKRIDQSEKDRLAALDAQERAQIEANGRQDAREDRRRETQRKREQDDFEERETFAKINLQTQLENIKTKAVEDKLAVETQRDADIQASNDALTNKQKRIDTQRETDYGKFTTDLSKRFRKLEEDFKRSMQTLDGSIPSDVKNLINGATAVIAGAASSIEAAIPQSSGSSGGASQSLNPEGMPFTGTPIGEVDGQTYYNTEEGWQEYLAAGGRGAGDPTQGSIFSTTLNALRTSLQARKAAIALIGGDSKGTSPVDSGPLPSGSDAISRAMAMVGNQAFNGMCERFVEVMNGTQGAFPDAKSAASALISTRGGRLSDAPRGQLVFFRADASNGNFGHVGIALGGGQFVSALYDGVKTQGASPYWNALYEGYGPPNFAGRRMLGGPVREGQPYLVGEVGAEVFVPDQDGRIVPNGQVQPASTSTVWGVPQTLNLTLQIDGRAFARVMAPLLTDEQNRQVRLSTI